MKSTLSKILDSDEYQEIKRELIETDRWTVLYRLIFSFDGKYYETYYHKAATEQQEGSGTDWDEELDCNEVHLVEKTIQVWEKIK